jgi:hypothetical protein
MIRVRHVLDERKFIFQRFAVVEDDGDSFVRVTAVDEAGRPVTGTVVDLSGAPVPLLPADWPAEHPRFVAPSGPEWDAYRVRCWHDLGLRCPQIARHTGLSLSDVYTICDRLGLVRR